MKAASLAKDFKPKKCVSKFGGAAIADSTAKQKVLNFVRRQRLCQNLHGIPLELKPTFGGLNRILEQYDLARLVGLGSFTEFQPYLLGKPIADSRYMRITAVFSNEDCLLNAYRNARSGLKCWASCDATYRVSSDERQGFVIIGTGCLGQHFKLISLAVVNKEDQEAMETIVRQTRDAVHKVVRDRAVRRLRV